MPRRYRHGSGEAIFHVLNRGAFRSQLFSRPSDYEGFLAVLRRGLERYGDRLLSFCMMPTHFHLVLGPLGDEELSRLMAWVTTTHALQWRRATHTAGEGAVYQGRFKSIPVQHDVHLLFLLRYVERNAARVRLVARAEDWPWSSASEHGRNGCGLALAPWPILRPVDWLQVLNRDEPAAGLDAIRTAIQRGQPFGDEQWRVATARKLGIEHTLRQHGGSRAAAPPPVSTWIECPTEQLQFEA